jgi:hypothetical protein
MKVGMNDYLLKLEMNSIKRELSSMQKQLQELLERDQTGEKLWDKSDMVRNWKVSDRTLASWRKEQRIGYVKIGGKIYYTPSNRNEFLEKYSKKLNVK